MKSNSGLFPCTLAQQRLWQHEQLRSGNPAHNLTMRWDLRGAADETAVRRAFSALTQRHEILRTCYIEREGTLQSELVTRMRLSKQAVQQLVVALEADGLVERLPDPDDARGKVVAFTAQGLALLADANEVKKKIERDYRAQLGAEGFAQLVQTLDRLDGSA